MWGKLWKRLMNIFKAKANATLDEMEDPVQMYKLGVDEFEQKMKLSELAVSRLMAQVTLRQKDLEQAKLEFEQRREQAKKAIEQKNNALKSGDNDMVLKADELAKRAIELGALAKDKAEKLQLVVTQLDAEAKKLKKDHERNVKQLKEKKDKYLLLKATAESAKVRSEVNQSLSEIGGDTALSNLNKFEEKIEQMNAESLAMGEIVNQGGRLDDELNEITIDAEVIDEMRILEAEAEIDRKAKEAKEAERLNEYLFKNQKKLEAPKKTIQLPEVKEDPKQLFEKHFNQADGNEKQKKIDDFFNNK